ncbi:hypothetical protein V6M85_03015 [Sulfolobus tengchongensis]|uniref:Uncharacterized protein n=1 Tax=Sulfolobus tengchongensis TaxID=207809 RepID=A0AAX4L244_9CREN
MKLQVIGNYIYITMWDRQHRRPRRFYLGRKEELKRWEELFYFAKELKVSKEEIDDYLKYYYDKEKGITKDEYIIMSLVIGEMFWSGNIKRLSGKQ